MNPKRCLTIAGSDSGAGAGIQADLKTFYALGVYGTSAITALTAQNTLGVRSIHAVPVEMVASQIAAVLEDIGTDAVKTGMLYNSEIVEAVASSLIHYACGNLVLDPVMRATSGDTLINGQTIRSIIERLFPLAVLVTPNLPEAELLLNRSIADQADVEAAARDILSLGARALLLKGGHGGSAESCDDCLVYRLNGRTQTEWLRAPRIETVNTHGTGCTLSAAIAARLALGDGLVEAVAEAKRYLSQALARGAKWTIGGGHGPIGH